jgi:hypothetical protein
MSPWHQEPCSFSKNFTQNSTYKLMEMEMAAPVVPVAWKWKWK